MIYLSKKSKETDTVFTDWIKILPQIRTNLNEYRKNQFKIKKKKYDNELKEKTDSIKDKKIGDLDVNIRELKPIKFPKAKYCNRIQVILYYLPSHYRLIAHTVGY